MAWAKLFLDWVSLWELIALLALIWLWRHPELLERITRVKVGQLEIELEKLREEVKEAKAEIRTLEGELEHALREPVEGFDPHAPIDKLHAAQVALKARARDIADFRPVREALVADPPDAAALFGVAVILRERRPLELFDDLVRLLSRLAAKDDLSGVRLNTVWKLTSALHRMLIAAVRDQSGRPISEAQLRLAVQALDLLEANPRVRADDPKSGVAGPIRDARRWIAKGLHS